MLGSLESLDSVCGNGTMLLLGNSILYSRFPMEESRKILHFYQNNPLGPVSIRYTPICRKGVWHNMYFVQLASHVLVVTCFIDKPFHLIERGIEIFKTSFYQSRFDFPIEVRIS